jgi:hypothetical protein
MTRTLSSAIVVALFALAALPTTSATAQMRVFVAAQGSDGNSCTFALPCRTLQRAHDTVAPLGDIEVLDPAGYGELIITKPVTIEGHGWGEISTSRAAAAAITVNAGQRDHVLIRGLNLKGYDAASDGIQFNTGAVLKVQDSSIAHFIKHGIFFAPTAASTLSLSNTRIASNWEGVWVNPSGSGYARGVFDRIVSEHNGHWGIVFHETERSQRLHQYDRERQCRVVERRWHHGLLRRK